LTAEFGGSYSRPNFPSAEPSVHANSHPNPPASCCKDLDGFFGLMIDNLILLILMMTLCRELIRLPDDDIFGRFCRARRSLFCSAMFSMPGTLALAVKQHALP
jgi:hypothetical protein